MKKKNRLPAVWAALFAAFAVGCLSFWLAGYIPELSPHDEKTYILCPEHLYLGKREPGSEEVLTFYIVNLSHKEISVVGEESSCSCTLAENIPITVPPKEAAEIKVRVRYPKDEETYDQGISFMVTTEKYLEMAPVRITASLDPSSPDGAETNADSGEPETER